MRITLTVTAGPHKGQEFAFAEHNTFLVGRSKHAHFRLRSKDKYFSRIHFMMEVNPPQCRLIDLNSHNGTYVNGSRVLVADLKDGDQIRAGHTILRLAVVRETGDSAEVPAMQGPTTADVQALKAMPGLASRVAGYHLIQELGQGNMGRTFLGRREGDAFLFAVKLIRPATEGTAAQAHQFLKAARILGGLQHPNIVRMHELGEDDGILYFVTDYIAGTDAARLMLPSRLLELPRVLRLADQLLAALQYAHGQNRVHRDIKPANLLLIEDDGKETVRLADFGLSYLYQKSQLSGLTMFQPGSVAFLAPECLMNYHDASPATDQYSLAASLYYLLTGRRPFDLPVEELSSQFSALLEQKAEPIRTHRPDLPAHIAAALDKALSRDPSERFADIGAFRKALLP